jgi:transposase
MADSSYRLQTDILGALPIIYHFLSRLGIDQRLARWVEAGDASVRLTAARVLGVVLRCLCLRREPLYALAEWAAPYDPALIGLAAEERELLNDDRVGRALARLFDADRASMLTELMVSMIATFQIDCRQLHNDSTTITFTGAYPEATGQARGGKATPVITYGHNKDHRPDLKQLLWILTVSADGAVPLAYRTEPGNTTDDPTHIPTWDGLVQLLSRADFLYVADSKLCSRPAMDHIASRGGRFLTVLPKTRREDAEFRAWIVTHVPDWQEVHRHPGRREEDPPIVYWAFAWPYPSEEGYRLCWFRSSQKIVQDAVRRADRLRQAHTDLEKLADRLKSPRSRFRDPIAVEQAVQAILEKTDTAKLITFTVSSQVEEHFRQESRGRPGPDTRYRRVTRPRLELRFGVDAAAVQAEAAADGVFPLITNDRTLTPAELLAAYKYQPNLEQRHAELKGPMEVAPVFLKDGARIEGLLCLEFIALLTRALIEREIRQAMQQHQLTELSLYPEDRACRAPTATRVLDIFTGLARHRLLDPNQDSVVQVFSPELSPLQRQVLDLLGVPETAYIS